MIRDNSVTRRARFPITLELASKRTIHQIILCNPGCAGVQVGRVMMCHHRGEVTEVDYPCLAIE
jgi:hypothetical protein